MKWLNCLAAVGCGMAWAASSAMANPQTHDAGYKMRGMTERPSQRSYRYYTYSTPVMTQTTALPMPSVAQQPTERRSFSFEPAQEPCVSVPPQGDQAQAPTIERRALSIEPAPAPTYQYYSAPSYRPRSFSRGAPYLRANSKAKDY